MTILAKGSAYTVIHDADHANIAPDGGPGDRDALLREMMPKLGLEPGNTGGAPSRRAVAWRYFLPKAALVLAVVLLAVGAWALLCVPAAFEDVAADSGDGSVAVDFSLRMTPLLDSVTAELDGVPVKVEMLNAGRYRIDAPKNGLLTLTARTFAGRVTTYDVPVDGVDETAPALVRDTVQDGVIVLYLADEGGSGVDWRSVSVTDAETGAALESVELDEQAGSVRFPFPASPARVSASDKRGNLMTVLLCPAQSEAEP